MILLRMIPKENEDKNVVVIALVMEDREWQGVWDMVLSEAVE